MVAQLNIFTDGGARGNPGPAGIGVVVCEDETVIFEAAKYLGEATNNEAEYAAILEALQWLHTALAERSVEAVVCHLDSQLVVNQLNRDWKIKEPRMRRYAEQCWALVEEIDVPVTFTHVPRAENSAADALVNQAVDAALV